MAGPLLRVLIRLKQNKYHRMQIAARYRIIDLINQLANELHLSVDQLLNISIYRHGPTGSSIVYPLTKSFNSKHYDLTMTFDKYGLSSNEELHIDLTDLTTNESDDAHSIDAEESSSASSIVHSNQAQTTNNNHILSNKKPLIGQLIRFSVPADNSCLFSSIYFVLHSGKFDLSYNKYLRNLVAKKIESDQITYSEAMLGRTNSDYCKWIRRDDSWGGGIELAILTNEYEIEICVINTECEGRIDYFGEDRHFPYRVFLLYDNLHYDPVYLVTYDVVQGKELIQTKFHRTDEAILSLAKELVDEFHSNTKAADENLNHSKTFQKSSTSSTNESHLMHVKI